jgi:hypothetical protein
MSVLTVRLTDEEEEILARRSLEAGLKRATFVRKLIREQPYRTASDLLTDMKRHWGDERLRIRKRR